MEEEGIIDQMLNIIPILVMSIIHMIVALIIMNN